MSWKDSKMKNVLVGIVFLLGTLLGTLSATLVSEELVYKVPAKYLTFGRVREMQAGKKIYYGKRPKGGKIIYILGGSAGYASANEHHLSEELTKRLGVPVQVYIVATSSQNIAESYSIIDKLPKQSSNGDAFVVMTWSGYRISSRPQDMIAGALNRDRMLMRHDAIKDLITNDDLLKQPFMLRNDAIVTNPSEYLAKIDKDHTSSVGSFWLKYFASDKVKKIARKKTPKNIFVDGDVFSTSPYSKRRLDTVALSYTKPAQMARFERNHKKYIKRLQNTIKKLTPEESRRHRDFSLYFMSEASKMANSRGYEYSTLELPLNNIVHEDPDISVFRKAFNTELIDLSQQKGFKNYYLDNRISELDPFNFWYDAGHMNPIGRKHFAPYYLDALERFLTGHSDGVYGIKTQNASLPLKDLPK